MLRPVILLMFIIMCASIPASGQQQSGVKWITFEQLEDSLRHSPKKTVLYFTAAWCVYCRKMDQNAFKNPEVVQILNNEYFAVKMDVESLDTIRFDGRQFFNEQAKTRRNGVHQLPLLLASRKNKKFSVPALILLDENFRQVHRKFEYLTSQDLKNFLTKSRF
ncbi:thioredoxin family protein [Salinimicrobium sp. GXAS 041]|uniref:thioredoxin family protein n=1 Tax=Salinimicrobium sp. GXAS 041 TaxID=3400806 RepID=UPI003C750833